MHQEDHQWFLYSANTNSQLQLPAHWRGTNLCSLTVHVMIGNFKENYQNLRSALHYRGLLPALWTNVDCNASKVLSPFHLHSCAAEEREKKTTATPGVNGVWKIPLEDIPWTCQHIMDQPIYASLFSFRWKSSTQTIDTQRPPSGFQSAPIACLVSAY